MLHYLFMLLALGAGWMAYTDGLIPIQVAAIGLFGGTACQRQRPGAGEHVSACHHATPE